MTRVVAEYMTTAQVARALGLSIGTVQNLVAEGQLDAVRTGGGHRRIFTASFEKYKKQQGYRAPHASGDRICILQQDPTLDQALLQDTGLAGVQRVAHPLDLLGLAQDIDVLFIDACHPWLQATPVDWLQSLQGKYTVYLYNCAQLQGDSPLQGLGVVHRIAAAIQPEFIAGYLAGRRAQ